MNLAVVKQRSFWPGGHGFISADRCVRVSDRRAELPVPARHDCSHESALPVATQRRIKLEGIAVGEVPALRPGSTNR